MAIENTTSLAEYITQFEANVRLRELGPVAGALLVKHTELARNALADPPPEPGEPDLWAAFLRTAVELSGPEHTLEELIQGTEAFLLNNGVKIPETLDTSLAST